MLDMYVRLFFFGKKINGIFQGTTLISVYWCEQTQSNRTTSNRNEFFIRFKEQMHWRKENDILEHSLALCQLLRRTPTVYKLMKATILLQTKRMHSISERRKIQNSWTEKFIAYFFFSAGIERIHLESGSAMWKPQYCIHWCAFMSEEII